MKLFKLYRFKSLYHRCRHGSRTSFQFSMRVCSEGENGVLIIWLPNTAPTCVTYICSSCNASAEHTQTVCMIEIVAVHI